MHSGNISSGLCCNSMHQVEGQSLTRLRCGQSHFSLPRHIGNPLSSSTWSRRQLHSQYPTSNRKLQITAFENEDYGKWAQKSRDWSKGNQGWKTWRDRSNRWKNPENLKREVKYSLTKPSVLLPVLAGLAAASTLGPLILAIIAGSLGLAFTAAAGATAVALFLPAALFIGGTLTVFSLLGSMFSLIGFLPLAALGWFFYTRSGGAKIDSAKATAQIKEDAWQAREYRRQQEEIEVLRMQSEELEEFDRRLRRK